MDRSLGVVQVEREVVGVVVGPAVGIDLAQVGAGIAADQAAHDVLRQRLLPAHQGQRGGEALQVPREAPEVGLVEVVDVEDEPAVGVEVGAEVLHVQVAVDPDAAAVLGGEGVLRLGHVGVEQAGAAAVERVRVARPSCGTCHGTPGGRPASGARRPPGGPRRSACCAALGLAMRPLCPTVPGTSAESATGGRSPSERSSSSASARTMPVSCRRQAPAGSGLILASTCRGWLAQRPQGEQVEVLPRVDEALPRGRAPHETQPQRQVERRHHQDRDGADRQAQPAREVLDRLHLRPAGRGDAVGGLGRLVERRRRPRRRRPAGRRRPRPRRAAAPRARWPTPRSAVPARRAAAWCRGLPSRPRPSRRSRRRRAGRRRSGGWRGRRGGVHPHGVIRPHPRCACRSGVALG